MTPTPAEIAAAAEILRRGGLVAFPTETVYGLGADAANADAVLRIFVAKGRPPDRALSVLVGASADPSELADWDHRAAALAARFWPGPLTIVRPRTARISDAVTAGADTVGLRMPAHPVALALLDAFGGGVAAPSANRSGHVSPTTADHVRDDLGGRIDALLDGGTCALGIESTVLSLVGDPVILRQGALGRAELEAALGVPVAIGASRASQTRPRAPLEVLPAPAIAALAATAPGPIGVLWRGPDAPSAPGWVVLSLPDHPDGYARALYDALRTLDGYGVARILAAAVPDDPAWGPVAARLAASAA